MPYITDINERDKLTGRTLLELAGGNGFVEVVTLLLASGATVNSTGLPENRNYYPPLWTICDAPLPVLQLLLDAGADAAWEDAGVSIVEHLLQTSRARPHMESNLDLLAWHGSRLPREETIVLWQAPVWESWTAGGERRDVVSTGVLERVPRIERVQVHTEYHEWVLVVSGTWDWGPLMWGQVELNAGCMCPKCPLWKTGGYYEVRTVIE